uniref:Uncharacterized protein n=1 Tax=Dunaliella tertiolecta TaxID=3047 RepID=A0A7S3VRE4_DUNTE
MLTQRSVVVQSKSSASLLPCPSRLLSARDASSSGRIVTPLQQVPSVLVAPGRPLIGLQAAGRPLGPPSALPPSSSTAVDVMPLFSLSEGLETPIQLMYLLALLGFLSVGAFLVVRQVLIRRELDEAAKGLGERIRTGEASCEDYFELGVILTRKKLFTQATKNLEKAKKVWDGEETELAQVHNALGYCYINMDRTDLAAAEYKRAVTLQPGYVTAWNNLGDAYEKMKQWRWVVHCSPLQVGTCRDDAWIRE